MRLQKNPRTLDMYNVGKDIMKKSSCNILESSKPIPFKRFRWLTRSFKDSSKNTSSSNIWHLIGRLNMTAADRVFPLSALKPSSSDSADRGRSIIRVITDVLLMFFFITEVQISSHPVAHGNQNVTWATWKCRKIAQLAIKNSSSPMTAADRVFPLSALKPLSSDSADRGRSIIRVITDVPLS
jgi:hypothetical protein